jgi:hypothetical protein
MRPASAELQLGAFALSGTDTPVCAPAISAARRSGTSSPYRARSAGAPPFVFKGGYLRKTTRAVLGIFPALIFAALLIGCAAPGEPYERKPPTPVAISDLSAIQSGSDVVLTFTLPQEAVDHRQLNDVPTIEIYRDFFKPPASGERPPAEPARPTLLVTIPSAMADRYATQGHVRYTDAFGARDFAAHPASLAVYTVRTEISEKKPSANSNVVSLRVFAPLEPIADLKTEVTHAAIVLTWTPPASTPSGSSIPVGGYHVYRGTADPSAPADQAKLKSPLVKIADASAPPFRDTQFEFGTAYIYSVRSVAQYPDAAIESSDSNLAPVTPRDTFPPAAPQDLLVVFVPAQGDAAAHLELSWAISPETDIAGYNVYRSDQAGTAGSRANTDVLPTPAFRDMNAQPGHRYSYTVTAVDRAGNESPASPSISGSVPAESQPTQ